MHNIGNETLIIISKVVSLILFSYIYWTKKKKEKLIINFELAYAFSRWSSIMNGTTLKLHFDFVSLKNKIKQYMKWKDSNI